MVTNEQRAAWERDGYFILRGFTDPALCAAMHARAVALARQAEGAGMADESVVMPEARPNPGARSAEDHVSKIFKLHRNETVYRGFIQSEAVLEQTADLIGPELDCFLSQFIFKNAGALGQPWHQDSHYFPFDRSPQVGIWLAVTAATVENGCLWVLPGSHREPVHTHVPDRRPNTNLGYVEIIDHDFSAAIPVTMEPGDVLIFHSHLMHRSTDNTSTGLRAAMVYHLAEAGTVDRASAPAFINDWMPVRRRVETEIDIEAPREKVLAVLRDAPGYADWNPYLVRVEGAIEAGGKIRALGRAADGEELSMEVEVVYLGPDGMRWQGGLPDPTQFKGDHFFSLVALAPGRTRLRHFENFTGTLVGEILSPRANVIRENFQRMNEALRSFCETA